MKSPQAFWLVPRRSSGSEASAGSRRWQSAKSAEASKSRSQGFRRSVRGVEASKTRSRGFRRGHRGVEVEDSVEGSRRRNRVGARRQGVQKSPRRHGGRDIQGIWGSCRGGDVQGFLFGVPGFLRRRCPGGPRILAPTMPRRFMNSRERSSKCKRTANGRNKKSLAVGVAGMATGGKSCRG